MNLSSFIFEQALKQTKIPASARSQLKLVSTLADANGDGFPSELIELSAPMIIRGLLNFSVLQINRFWVYPYWVHQQLDPMNRAYVARSQNPLLINITNRNWTTLGSPTGFHEAIVDPRGLVTPLPREWSIDTWLVESGQAFFPSLSETAHQQLDTSAPTLTTAFFWRDLWLSSEAFVGSVHGATDVVFCRASVFNASSATRKIRLGIAIRPFGPEGVAPIERIEYKSRKISVIDGAVGVVFAQEPNGIIFGNSAQGDVSTMFQQSEERLRAVEKSQSKNASVRCDRGLAQSVAIFDLELGQAGVQSICYSVALGSSKELARTNIKGTWKVSFERRREEQRETWRKELEEGSSFQFGDGTVQELFNASRLTLLQLHDGSFISPGPYLYHHFWFRDSAPMLKALDVLGFSKRARQVINAFPERLTPEGFFRGPSGEWDSNGAVLWTIYQHYQFTRSLLWLKELYPQLVKAGRWIIRMRKRTRTTDTQRRGLMPKSLSAEHLGMVDQYYWDSFWSLAGLKALLSMAKELNHRADVRLFEKEVQEFEADILESFREVEDRLGEHLIPSAPFRPFDESAIGSFCSVYPLNLFGSNTDQPQETVKALIKRFVDDRGFFHPIIHSGYNPYLTLQLAHALFTMGDIDGAWKIAQSVFRQASSSNAFPEAIHPRTGGGAMGDGHHGWAAAEVVLFIRDCLLHEEGRTLSLFRGAAPHMLKKGKDLKIVDAQTSFGKITVSLVFESDHSCQLSFSPQFFPDSVPDHLEVYLPWKLQKVIPSSPHNLLAKEDNAEGVRLKFSPDLTAALLQIED